MVVWVLNKWIIYYPHPEEGRIEVGKVHKSIPLSEIPSPYDTDLTAWRVGGIRLKWAHLSSTGS